MGPKGEWDKKKSKGKDLIKRSGGNKTRNSHKWKKMLMLTTLSMWRGMDIYIYILKIEIRFHQSKKPSAKILQAGCKKMEVESISTTNFSYFSKSTYIIGR